ncbi:MAG: YIP1 family protein [Verrucomicrobiota bacterium]
MDQPPPIPPSQNAAPRAHAMSLLARLLNVFAIPSAVFEDVRTARASIANWLVPILISAAVGSVTAHLFLSQPAPIQELRNSQKKSHDELVESGKLSRAEADKMDVLLERMTAPAVLKVISPIIALALSFARVFWWAFVLWFIGTSFLKLPFSYFKSLEVAGLATLISVLAAIVGLVLTAGFGDSNSGVTLSQLNEKARTPVVMLLANVFSLWLVGTMACGLARLTGVRFARTFLMVLSYWIVWQIFLGLIGLAALGLAT